MKSLEGKVDPNGILREDALEEPLRTGAFTVFAQRTDVRVELSTWQRHAEQFFDARLGLTTDKRYRAPTFPTVDAALVVLAPRAAEGGTRLCYGRPRTDDDLRAAEDADARAGNTGLGLLARRCGSVWLVVTESKDDQTALLLSAILASVVLGPILAPDQQALFGVKTARAKLEALGGP